VGDWVRELDGAAAAVNLAGESIASGRWTETKKAAILQSRLAATKALVEGLERARNKPHVIIQASGVGYYGSRGDEQLDESSSAGAGFLAEVARKWEEAIRPVEALGARVVTVRLGVVLGAGGGFMARAVPVFRLHLAGYPGKGEQWFSWIHTSDVVGAVRFLTENDSLRGIFNLVSPNPMSAKDFFWLLGEAAGHYKVRAVPAVILRMLMGSMADELLLSSQRTFPRRLLQAGYRFKYADAQLAIENAIHRTA